MSATRAEGSCIGRGPVALAPGAVKLTGWAPSSAARLSLLAAVAGSAFTTVLQLQQRQAQRATGPGGSVLVLG